MKISLTIEGLTARQALALTMAASELDGAVCVTENSDMGEVTSYVGDDLLNDLVRCASVADVGAALDAEDQARADNESMAVTMTVGLTDGDAVEVTPGKAKRKRRTKAEMAAARAVADTVAAAHADAANLTQAQADLKTSEQYAGAKIDVAVRKRTRSTPAETPAASETPPVRKRTVSRGVIAGGKTPALAPEPEVISNPDLAKACSLAARKAGPDPVKAILEQFGVATVGAIPAANRREFLDLVGAL